MENRTRDIVAEGVALSGSYRHVGQFLGMVGGRMLARIGDRAEARGERLAWTTATVTVSRYAPQEWQVEACVSTEDPDAPQAVNDGTVPAVDHWRGRAVLAEQQVADALALLSRGSADPVTRRAVAILSGVEDEAPGAAWQHG